MSVVIENLLRLFAEGAPPLRNVRSWQKVGHFLSQEKVTTLLSGRELAIIFSGLAQAVRTEKNTAGSLKTISSISSASSWISLNSTSSSSSFNIVSAGRNRDGAFVDVGTDMWMTCASIGKQEDSVLFRYVDFTYLLQRLQKEMSGCTPTSFSILVNSLAVLESRGVLSANSKKLLTNGNRVNWSIARDNVDKFRAARYHILSELLPDYVGTRANILSTSDLCSSLNIYAELRMKNADAEIFLQEDYYPMHVYQMFTRIGQVMRTRSPYCTDYLHILYSFAKLEDVQTCSDLLARVEAIEKLPNWECRIRLLEVIVLLQKRHATVLAAVDDKLQARQIKLADIQRELWTMKCSNATISGEHQAIDIRTAEKNSRNKRRQKAVQEKSREKTRELCATALEEERRLLQQRISKIQQLRQNHVQRKPGLSDKVRRQYRELIMKSTGKTLDECEPDSTTSALVISEGEHVDQGSLALLSEWSSANGFAANSRDGYGLPKTKKTIEPFSYEQFRKILICFQALGFICGKKSSEIDMISCLVDHIAYFQNRISSDAGMVITCLRLSHQVPYELRLELLQSLLQKRSTKLRASELLALAQLYCDLVLEAREELNLPLVEDGETSLGISRLQIGGNFGSGGLAQSSETEPMSQLEAADTEWTEDLDVDDISLPESEGILTSSLVTIGDKLHSIFMHRKNVFSPEQTQLFQRLDVGNVCKRQMGTPDSEKVSALEYVPRTVPYLENAIKLEEIGG